MLCLLQKRVKPNSMMVLFLTRAQISLSSWTPKGDLFPVSVLVAGYSLDLLLFLDCGRDF